MVDTVVTISELDVIREWVREKNYLTYRAVTDITPFAALQANALSHLRKDWIDWYEDYVVITIPRTAECNQVKGTPGPGEYLVERQRPCLNCRTTGDTNKFEATPPCSYQTETRSRRVVLHRRMAEPAIETLEHIFKTRGRKAIGFTRQGVQQVTQDISEASPLDRQFSYNELMRTQLLIHAAYGVDLKTIHEQSPFYEALNRRIIRESKFDHPEMDPYMQDDEFLSIIQQNAPLSIDEIASIADKGRSGVRTRVRNLKERDRVEVVKKEQVNGGRYKTQFWDVTKPPSEPYRCQYGCGKTSDSLGGIRSHEGMMHE